ncbi:MAG: NFACT RNA binding domain-containing protein [Candidatus Micrarchaeota archaeon]
MKIELDVKKSARENAAELYDESKKYRAKAEGARKAIEETKRLLAKERKKTEKQAVQQAEKKVRVVKEHVKREWFEAFRWFHTSGGFLVIAGKDAKQNDLLYAKHLDSRDLFFHAHITGAPATILKVASDRLPPAGPSSAAPSETDKREAAQFAASFSSAWKKGLHSIDVYCVTGDNVDKHSTGEYVGKGAFMIRGKREWFKGTELKLAVGVVGGKLVAVPETMKKPGMAVIAPGSGEKQAISQEINKRFGINDMDAVNAVLPSGDSSFV